MRTRVRRLAGDFWHQCSPIRRLLDVADPAVTSGRYHRIGGYGVWYASSSEVGAWAELFRHHYGGVSLFEVRRLIGRVHVRDLRILDLTNEQIRAELGITARDLVSDDLSRCQLIAERARSDGYEAILAPSAALQRQTTFGSVHLRAGQNHRTERSRTPRAAQDDSIFVAGETRPFIEAGLAQSRLRVLLRQCLQ